jgi:methylenetetrahydrofolate dehydrogenase (NADP+)/methenyltetrahydrofolate cyclohydrolase
MANTAILSPISTHLIPFTSQLSMSATILDGKSIAETIRSEIAADVKSFVKQHGVTPKLAAVLVGDDPASEVYVRNKERACEKVGITSQLHRLPVTTSQAELLQLVQSLNQDTSVHGILVQLPLPTGDPRDPLDERAILDAVHPNKDVDCFSPVNVGLLVQGRPRFLPCTPHGVTQILWRYNLSVSGKRVVVIGRSDIVGKPIAIMLALRSGSCGPGTANATVTMAHSRSQNLPEIVRQADCVIAAVGVPELITGDMIRPGAIVIDVGINRLGDRLVGDVNFEQARQIASAITPVPGGIGPLTIAMLLRNTLTAASSFV